MSEDEAKAKIEAKGYRIAKFKIDGNCYEIYGTDRMSKKVEIYYDTKTLANHLRITLSHEITDDGHLLFTGYSMHFYKFAPLNLEAGAPQNIHLQTDFRDRNQRVLCAVGDQKLLAHRFRREFLDQLFRVQHVAADADNSRQQTRQARGGFNGHEASLGETG